MDFLVPAKKKQMDSIADPYLAEEWLPWLLVFDETRHALENTRWHLDTLDIPAIFKISFFKYQLEESAAVRLIGATAAIFCMTL